MARRAVVIGGILQGESAVEGVAEALENTNYKKAEPFTFSYALKNPDFIFKAMVKADAFTMSSGIIPVQGTLPEAIVAFGAPVPTGKARLIGRSVVKATHMHMPGRGIKSSSDVKAVARYDRSAIAEFGAHPWLNTLGSLGQISRFNSVNMAKVAVHSEIPTDLVYGQNDDYFQLTYEQITEAINNGVGYSVIPGEHDELALRPTQTLERYFASK